MYIQGHDFNIIKFSFLLLWDKKLIMGFTVDPIIQPSGVIVNIALLNVVSFAEGTFTSATFQFRY